MREPSLRTSRLVIAGGLAAAVALGAAGYFVGRATAPVSPPPAIFPTPLPTIAPPRPPELPGVLRRADMVAFASQAADAAASGLPLPQSIRNLAGRWIDLALPFGCAGPAPADGSAPMRWRYDASSKTLRVNISMTRWALSDWGLAAAQAPAGFAEGYWVERPWSSAEACPAPQAPVQAPEDAPPPAVPETFAVAQFTMSPPAKAPRSLNAVKRLEPEEFHASQGFRLRLTGRVQDVANGGPIRCLQPGGPDERPICVLAVSFDEALVETIAGQPIATWSLGQTPHER